LSVQQLEAGYGESVILRNVDIRVDAGQVVCLLGRNGVGKTTLMKTIMGVLKARRGTVRFRGADLTHKPPGARARSGIGYVPQGRDIFPHLTVYENLQLGLEACRAKRSAIPEEALEMFPALAAMFERKGGDLSGGQQQQLAIARALVAKPELLLLDEPTEGIQPSVVQNIRDVIRGIKRGGRTAILLVEQSIDFVKSVADHYYVMDRGAIVASGPIGQLDEAAVRNFLSV